MADVPVQTSSRVTSQDRRRFKSTVPRRRTQRTTATPRVAPTISDDLKNGGRSDVNAPLSSKNTVDISSGMLMSQPSADPVQDVSYGFAAGVVDNVLREITSYDENDEDHEI